MKAWLKHFFIPHEGNDYAPHSLQRAAVVGMMVLILISFAVTNLQSILWISSQWMVSTVLPSVIINETNQARAGSSLAALRESPALDRAARLKAEDMAARHYFSHNSPTGITPWYWFGQAGYSFVHAGENLAVHFTDSKAVVDAWLASPEHRANIMDGTFSEIGIGTAQGELNGYPTVFVVQLFGTPAAHTQVAQTVPPPALARTLTPSTSTSAAPGTTAGTSTVLADTYPATTANAHATSTTPTPASSTMTAKTTTTRASSAPTVTMTDHGVVAYSDFVSTTTGGVPASIDPQAITPTKVSWWAQFATQPHRVLQLLYGFITAFVLLALGLSVAIEIRRQQPLQVAYSIALFVLMGGLLYVHAFLTGGALIV